MTKALLPAVLSLLGLCFLSQAPPIGAAHADPSPIPVSMGPDSRPGVEGVPLILMNGRGRTALGGTVSGDQGDWVLTGLAPGAMR